MTQRSILVTGAASGIGAATARHFAGEGWKVGIYDLNSDTAQALASELGENSRAGLVDVTDELSVEAALADFAGFTGGSLDVLCNNAGLFQDMPMVEADPAYLGKMIEVNTQGVVNCARLAFQLLKDTPGSRLINIGSAASIYGVPMEAVYSASKFFVRGLTEALALEWKPHGIGVSVIMPAYVTTPMTANNPTSWAGEARMMAAEDVAAAVWRAAHCKRQYWILPRLSRLQFTLVSWTPLKLLPALAGWMYRRMAAR